MVERYLATRPNLVLSVLIIDSRRGPTELDLQMVEWLEANHRPYVTVATKADKLSANELRVTMKRSTDLIGKDVVIAYSAVKRTGQDRLWKEITTRIDKAGSGPRD
jgi:GTP-binding protein